ncbi:kinase-like protein [Dendrothele bispora CBS 962.96]|uniref:non-specific serine/threonine protein kinase n=1 Tax=Dendrothele bispora (strain CBS 962.96) TaxID=1314807 RepID=A0A4S8MP37_DENBC|nr:kinase-like protein [Dendrothele bispora CBS 962.96]
MSFTIQELEGCSIMDGHFKLKKLLGSGSFGTVYLATRARPGVGKEIGEKFAVKVIPRPELASEEKKKLDAELKLQAMAGGHWNVVEVREVSYETLKGEEFACIRMDLSEGGDMARAIRKGVFNKEERVRSAFLQIIDGMLHCHENGVYHRDLKPGNVLFSMEGKNIRMRIADFGLATDEKVCNDGRFPGTPKYMPPGLSMSVDPFFRAYMDDPSMLGQYLPRASNELVRMLRRSVLTLDPSSRVSLQELRDFVETAPLFKEGREKGFLAKIFNV